MEERIIKDINNLLTQLFQKIREAGYKWDAERLELKKIEQKPAWSEQDRTMAFTLMRDVDQMSYISKEGKNERIVWLNSLDEKFASTESIWGEEDEKMLNDIDIIFFEEKSIPNVKYWKFMNWLKSPKERYTWKPSEEQMKVLYKYAEQNNYDGTILTSLYNDLKQL